MRGVLSFDRLDLGKLDVFHVAEALLAIADEGDILAADTRDFCNLNLLNGRQTDWEDTFNADGAGHLANRHGFADFRATHLDHHSFKYLHALFFLTVRSRFLNLLVDANRHPRADLRGLNDSWKGDLVGHRWREEYEKFLSPSSDYGFFGFWPDNWSSQVWIK